NIFFYLAIVLCFLLLSLVSCSLLNSFLCSDNTASIKIKRELPVRGVPFLTFLMIYLHSLRSKFGWGGKCYFEEIYLPYPSLLVIANEMSFREDTFSNLNTLPKVLPVKSSSSSLCPL